MCSFRSIQKCRHLCKTCLLDCAPVLSTRTMLSGRTVKLFDEFDEPGHTNKVVELSNLIQSGVDSLRFVVNVSPSGSAAVGKVTFSQAHAETLTFCRGSVYSGGLLANMSIVIVMFCQN